MVPLGFKGLIVRTEENLATRVLRSACDTPMLIF
jgi:hypothetical protein